MSGEAPQSESKSQADRDTPMAVSASQSDRYTQPVIPLSPLSSSRTVRPGLIVALALTVIGVSLYLALGGGDFETVVEQPARQLVNSFGSPHPMEQQSLAAIPREKPAGSGGPPPMSSDEARNWKTKADAGDAYAQFRMGVIYAYGLGDFPENMPEAVRYYQMAVAQGNWKAEYNLGLLYESGTGASPKTRRRRFSCTSRLPTKAIGPRRINWEICIIGAATG